MSREYSTQKIKEALQATRGNASKARQMVTAAALDDPKLLRELVKPHMVGIVAHAVSRVVNGKAEDDNVAQVQAQAQSASSAEEDASFGLDILKTIAGGDTTQFGQEMYGGRPISSGKKGGVSQAHIDAIQEMIKNNKG